MTAISMEQPHAENRQSAPADGLEMTVFDREHRNRLQSRICALPEELVLEIMSCMRLTELYLTRQVSHLFFRLSGAIPFRELRFPKESDSASNFYNRYRYNDNRHVVSHSQPVFNAYVWKIHPPIVENPLEIPYDKFSKWCNCSEKVAFTLRRQSLCQPCSQQIPDENQLAELIADYTKDVWCSVCKTNHKAMWFSHEKPHEQPEGSRRCILWEGRIRLCSHLSFRWTDINHWKSRRRNLPHGGSIFECDQCLVGVSGAQNPAVRAFAEVTKTKRGKEENRYKIEMSWRLPASLIESCSSKRRTYDNMLCRHVTWTEILRHIVPGQLPGLLECSICSFQYSWTKAESGEETLIQGWRILWRPQRIQASQEIETYDDLEPPSKSLLLDPESYQTHNFSKHVLWCDTKGCYNAQGDFRNILDKSKSYKKFIYRPLEPNRCDSSNTYSCDELRRTLRRYRKSNLDWSAKDKLCSCAIGPPHFECPQPDE